MKSISVTAFKAHCLELINEVARTGQPLIVTKRGKPTAMLTTPPSVLTAKWTPGQFEGTIKVVGDIIGPIDSNWDALN